MSPLESYQADLKQYGFQYDSAQERIFHYAQALYLTILKRQQTKSPWWRRWFKSPRPIKGLYLWGGVGRGKTYVLDKLHQTLPLEKKQRVHFHDFMQSIHRKLTQVDKSSDPLEQVAESIAQQAECLLLDEFHVQDIADAMLLYGLLKALFKRNVILVTTSNIQPDELYKEGLQRQQFLPAIELIKAHTHVLELSEGIDYRQTRQAGIKHYADTSYLQSLLDEFSIKPADYDREIEINNRIVKTRAANSKIVWFDFSQICETARSAADYVELARRYEWVIVSEVPVLDENRETPALRFIYLIDALYDHRVKLHLQAERNPLELYHGRLFRFQFERTASRLTEMCGPEYKRLPWREQETSLDLEAEDTPIEQGSIKQTG